MDVAVDKTTLTTELKTSNPITITVTGSGGFSGDVAIAASVVDGAGVALPGWAVELNASSVTLAANGTATAMAIVKVPSKSTGMAGTLKVTTTSAATAGTTATTSAITAMDQITFAVKVDPATGKCVFPADAGSAANPVPVSQSTKIRFFNTGAANLVIHSGGPISHQGQAPNGTADPTTEPNTAYEQLPTRAGAASWYCHAPDTNLGANNPQVIVQ